MLTLLQVYVHEHVFLSLSLLHASLLSLSATDPFDSGFLNEGVQQVADTACSEKDSKVVAYHPQHSRRIIASVLQRCLNECSNDKDMYDVGSVCHGSHALKQRDREECFYASEQVG